MVFDSHRNVVVLYGGNTGASVNGETWEWNGMTWALRSSIGPAPRAGQRMAFDSARNVTVLFGGQLANFSYNDETWEWDGATWTQRLVAGPAGRAYSAMAFDSNRSRTVLHGGVSTDGTVSYGDTWEWDGASWTSVSNSGPAPRFYHALVFDSARGVSVLFGGKPDNHSSTLLGDVWEWDGSSWTASAAIGPSARDNVGMAYDAGRRRAVVFGGSMSSGTTGELWEYGSTESIPGFISPGPDSLSD